jgi:hypothetical protein
MTRLVVPFHVALGFLQLVLFAQVVAEGRALDLLSLPEPLYRVDGLGLALGVGWCLAVTLAAWTLDGVLKRNEWSGIHLCLMTIGMLNAFYARQPLALYLGWELAGWALWCTLRSEVPRTVASSPADKPASYGYKARLSALAGNTGWVLHVSGWPLLLVVLLGLVAPFAPPAGGVAQAWPLAVALSMAAVVLIRSGCPPFDGWLRGADAGSGRRYTALLALYAIATPILLGKMLVAAPWDRLGIWTLALLGTTALLGSLLVPIIRVGAYHAIAPASVCSTAVLIGFALSPGSPLAATGAVALMLSGMIWAVTYSTRNTQYVIGARLALLLGALPGVWFVSQGALELKYGLIAALILPAVAFLVMGVAYQGEGIDSLAEGGSRTVSTDLVATPGERYSIPALISVALLTLAAIYPQALVEFVLRSAVSAMAGGVGALSTLKSDWGLGLQVASAQGVIQAALPATGIALAVFLSWVTLYWLKGLLVRIVPAKSPWPGAEPE